MHSTTEAAVRSLRAKIVHEVETLAKMERTFEQEYFKNKCRFAIQDVEAADTMFLRPMETETWRTPADELRTFSCAEAVFELGVSARRQLQEILNLL